MKALFQLEIPKRNSQCAHQGERLLPGMEIYSLLIEEGSDTRLGRKDFCSACWPQVRQQQGSDPLARGYWKSKIEQRKSVEGSSRVERALALLRSMLHDGGSEEESIGSQQDIEKEDKIFILCLFLSHARQLALRQEIEKEGVQYHLYEIVKQEEFLTIKVVNLMSAEIANLQKSLAEELQLCEANRPLAMKQEV